MSETEHRFTLALACPHCEQNVPMQIVASHAQISDFQRRRIVYELLLCPACEAVTLRSYAVSAQAEQSKVDMKTLYPETHERQFGQPYPMRNNCAAEKIKTRAVMLRHLGIIHECNRARSA